MKRLLLVMASVSAAVLALLNLYHLPEAHLSLRILHPRSSQLVEKIECGQAVVPRNYEILEVEETATISDERMLVSRTEALSGEDFTGVEVAKDSKESDIYLRLSEEGIGELYDLVWEHPDRKVVIVTETGEVLPVELVRRNLPKGRLEIQLDPKAGESGVRDLAATLSKDI